MQRVVDVALERKALDVVVIDVRGRSSYTDYIVIASGTSDRHVQSVAENVEVTIKHEGQMSIGREGLREGQWALIDFGGVVLHVFHQFTREVYHLESMWEDAPRVPVQAHPPAMAAGGAYAPGP
jgi:ribosome-associated protein